MKTQHIFKLAVASASIVLSPASAEVSIEDPEIIQQGNDAAWLDEAKFGLFIHWGIYSQRGCGEWVMSNKKIQIDDYKKNAETFNPVQFDAKEWVSVAKDAGMKYIIITSKHHDGFCLFDSDVDDYNSVDGTPFGRDIIKELKEECDKQGIRFGVYYSQAQDWYHPGGQNGKRVFDPKQEGDFQKYLHEVSIPQIKELITNYGVEHLWFDTPIQMNIEDGYAIGKVVQELAPKTLMNSRLLYHGNQAAGLNKEQLDQLEDVGVDFLSYKDRTIPENSPWEYWETCMTLSNAWGYREGDDAWKDRTTVIRMLTEVASKGGTLLLNVGPTGEGVIPAEGVNILKSVGDWLQINGEAIYGAERSPYGGYGEYSKISAERLKKIEEEERIARETGAELGASPESLKRTLDKIQNKRMHVSRDYHWLTTGRKGKVYVHVFKWDSSPIVLKDFKGEVRNVYCLADQERTLDYNLVDGTLSITLTGEAPDPASSVLCIKLK